MIEVKNLTKHFGGKSVVEDISFKVEKGEILGFLGPNGAGKSTTMRMLTGFLTPTEGSAFIGGCNVLENPNQATAMTGYLPENAPVYPDMTVFGYLDFCAEIRGFSKDEKKKRVEACRGNCFF